MPEAPHGGPHHAFFDLWSRFYDAPLVQRLTYRPVHDAVVPVLRRATARSVLDVGCGTGLLTTRLRSELPGSRVTGCDFSSGMLGRASRRSDRVRWVQGNALELPFRSRSFDAVVSTESFHWFPDQGAALAEFYRVLRPGGRLLVALASPPLDVMSEASRIGSRWLGEPLYWPTRDGLRAILLEAGFSLDEQQRILRLPAPLLFPTYLTVALRPD